MSPVSGRLIECSRTGRPRRKIEKTRADILQERLRTRLRELDLEAQISPLPPVIQGGFVVVPLGLIHDTQ